MLLWPSTRRVGALAIALISVVFFSAALLSALARGLTLDCGCFGIGPPSRPRMWLELALNVVFLSGALSVYLGATMGLLRPAQHGAAIRTGDRTGRDDR